MEKLRRRIAGITGRLRGKAGVSVLNLETGEEIGVRQDELFPMASVCKTPILVEAYRQAETGTLDLKKRVSLTRETRVSGSGLLNFFQEGLEPALSDLLLLMIVISDNAATDLVLGEIGGTAKVTETMRLLGLPSIRLDNTIQGLISNILCATDERACGLDYFALEGLFATNAEVKENFRDRKRVIQGIASATEGRDEASPKDIARLYAQIVRYECASEASCQAMIKTLGRQLLKARLPRELPMGAKLCHKTGTLGDGAVTNDSGILFIEDRPVATIAVLSREMEEPSATIHTAIARIGQAVYRHFC